MREKLTDLNAKRKPVIAMIGMGLAGLALTGCGARYESNADFRKVATPATRYGFDYSGTYPERVTEDRVGLSCLDTSPYALGRKVLVTKEGDDGVMVTAESSRFKPLHFSGLTDTERPLQPADTYTAEILRDYNCVTAADGRIKPYDDN